MTEPAANRGSEDHAETHGGSDHAHALGTVLLGGHVGDGGEGRRKDRRREQTAQGPGREEARQAVGEAEPQERDRVAQETEDQEGFAAVAIREPSPEGGDQELRERVGGHHGPDEDRIAMKRAGVIGHGGNHHAEAHHHGEDRDEKDEERLTRHGNS
ncbi:hypothetical protein D3C86_1351970 [compost metagenome]